MSNPLYQNRGNSQSHEDEWKRPPLSAKDLEAGVFGTRPLGLMNVPGLLREAGRGRSQSEWPRVIFFSYHFRGAALEVSSTFCCLATKLHLLKDHNQYP